MDGGAFCTLHISRVTLTTIVPVATAYYLDIMAAFDEAVSKVRQQLARRRCIGFVELINK